MTDYHLGLIITLIMGLGWGSFATMAVYRLPRNMPWVGDEPRCFSCKTPLTILDYFSIFSYFILKGKCRHCGVKYELGIGYLITEIAITALLILCYIEHGFSDIFVLLGILVVGGVITLVIDAEHKKIPSKCLILLMMLGLVYRTFIDQTFYGAFYGAVIGALAGVFFRYVYFFSKGKKEVGKDFMQWKHEDRFIGEGFDCVKMLMIAGIYLPLTHFLVFILINLAVIFILYIFCKKYIRIGTIMISVLIFMTIYSNLLDKFLLI